MLGLLALSIIPSFNYTRRGFKEYKNQKMPVEIVMIYSASIPLFAFVNNYLTGKYRIFSGFIGILFAIIALKYR